MRLLIVEDEPRMATLLKRGFVGEGYAVDIATSGIDGLWMGTGNPYEAIVLDVMLPGKDGFEVCRALRAEQRWAPIIMLTARDAVDDRVHGLDAGADDYLAKPFSFAELSARVRALVRRGAHARPTTIEVGDLRFDPARHRAWRGSTELALSPKEMALLELFLRHPDEVITRTQILEHVWDFAYDGLSNVVDQYVSYLRKKIDKPFGRNDFQTVRGVVERTRLMLASEALARVQRFIVERSSNG